MRFSIVIFRLESCIFPEAIALWEHSLQYDVEDHTSRASRERDPVHVDESERSSTPEFTKHAMRWIADDSDEFVVTKISHNQLG